MEDVLDVYERAYDPIRPVVCIDESSKQLVAHSRDPIPAGPGSPEKWDYEYVRNGVADVFMVFEPLGAKRHVRVTRTRTRADFAETLRVVSDELYPHAERIVLVMDNLNTHTMGSLYESFPPEEANWLARRFEVHYTPKHGSWLDMAEIELGVLMRQGLPARVGTLEETLTAGSGWYKTYTIDIGSDMPEYAKYLQALRSDQADPGEVPKHERHTCEHEDLSRGSLGGRAFRRAGCFGGGV